MHVSLATRKTLHNLSFVLKCHFSAVGASTDWFGFVLFSIWKGLLVLVYLIGSQLLVYWFLLFFGVMNVNFLLSRAAVLVFAWWKHASWSDHYRTYRYAPVSCWLLIWVQEHTLGLFGGTLCLLCCLLWEFKTLMACSKPEHRALLYVSKVNDCFFMLLDGCGCFIEVLTPCTWHNYWYIQVASQFWCP